MLRFDGRQHALRQQSASQRLKGSYTIPALWSPNQGCYPRVSSRSRQHNRTAAFIPFLTHRHIPFNIQSTSHFWTREPPARPSTSTSHLRPSRAQATSHAPHRAPFPKPRRSHPQTLDTPLPSSSLPSSPPSRSRRSTAPRGPAPRPHRAPPRRPHPRASTPRPGSSPRRHFPQGQRWLRSPCDRLPLPAHARAAHHGGGAAGLGAAAEAAAERVGHPGHRAGG